MRLVNNISMEYLYKLRELRKQEKISQEDLAKELGISQNTYSQYETGKRELPLNTLIDLANYYYVSTDYILGLTDNPSPYPKRK